MKRSMTLSPVNNKCITAAAGILLILAAVGSLFVGKYPLTVEGLLAGDEMQLKVLLTLRLARMIVGAAGGFSLGIAGFVYQTAFRNPLASPDIVGVSSGAGAGAAAGILFLSGTAAVTLSAFGGALLAAGAVLAFSALDRSGKNSTIVLAGIAVHSLAQTVLMILKLSADPEKELAAIEYWLMGSLNGISIHSVGLNLILCILCAGALFLLHRQVILLAGEEGEIRTLGVDVKHLRMAVLIIATLAVSAVVSMTGLISFVGLLAPHLARMLTRNNRPSTMLLSGLIGGIVLCGADMLARCVTVTELPVSIFTSLLGAPFLIFLIVKGRKAS